MTTREAYAISQILDRPVRAKRKARRRGLLARIVPHIQFPERSEEYKAWVRSLPCAVSFCGRAQVEAAHTGSDGGTGIKASDFTCVPLCGYHHTAGPHSYHGLGGGKRAFEALHAISFDAIVARLNAKWGRPNGA